MTQIKEIVGDELSNPYDLGGRERVERKIEERRGYVGPLPRDVSVYDLSQVARATRALDNFRRRVGS